MGLDDEMERRQDVVVVEEQPSGALLLDITQSWLSAQSLAVAAADSSSHGLRRDQSPERASGPPQGAKLSLGRSLSKRPDTEISLERSSCALLNDILPPERSSGASKETEFSLGHSPNQHQVRELSPERSSTVGYAMFRPEFQERKRGLSSDAESGV